MCDWQVLTRLRQLIWMERTLDHCLSQTPSFRLPAAVLDAAASQKEQDKAAKAAAKAADKAAAAADKAAARQASGKGKAKAPPPKRRKKGGDGIDSSEDEADDDEAEPEVYGGGGMGGGGGGGGTSKGGGGGGGAAPKPKAAPKPGTLPTLTFLNRVSPYLRSLSLDVCKLLTYNVVSDAPESEELEIADEITPPSLHYLMAHTHANLKRGLAGGGGLKPGGAAPAEGGRAIATGQDLAQMELRRLSPSQLLERLAPVLLALRQHCTTLSNIVPAALSEREVVDDDAAFHLDKEQESLQARFAGTQTWIEPPL